MLVLLPCRFPHLKYPGVTSAQRNVPLWKCNSSLQQPNLFTRLPHSQSPQCLPWPLRHFPSTISINCSLTQRLSTTSDWTNCIPNMDIKTSPVISSQTSWPTNCSGNPTKNILNYYYFTSLLHLFYTQSIYKHGHLQLLHCSAFPSLCLISLITLGILFFSIWFI